MVDERKNNDESKVIHQHFYEKVNVVAGGDIKGIDLQLVETKNTPLGSKKNYSNVDEEKNYFKKSKMRGTTAPSRIGLELLLEENISTETVARAWNKGFLWFNDSHQFEVDLNPNHPRIGMASVFLAALFGIAPSILWEIIAPAGYHLTPHQRDVLLIINAITFSMSIFFAWRGMRRLVPFLAAKRAAIFIPKINEMLRNK